MRGVRAHYIQLEPRYTPGSPAGVTDERLARHVADGEKEAYQHCLEGAYGERDAARAKERGLSLIVFEMVERASGWVVHDWITDEWWWWPMTATCPTCKATKVDCRRGHLTEHTMRGSDRLRACDAGDTKPTFVGRKLIEEYQQRFTYNGK